MAQSIFRQRLVVVGPLMLLILITALLPPRRVFAAPTVVLDPPSGPAGTLSLFGYGSGWPVGHSIEVRWEDGRLIGESINPVNGTGNFTAYFSAPQDATPGNHTVIFQDTTDTGVSAQATFKVTIPTITLQPTSGPPGTAVTAIGSGWPGGENIELNWDGNDFLNDGIADNAGQVTILFTVPANAVPGDHLVLVNFSNGDFPVEVRVTFTVTSPIGNCTTSSSSWQNKSITSQTGTFIAEFDATPNNAPMDGVMGFSAGLASAYANLAAIARFSPQGFIDARNGGAYQAASQIPYTAGVSYHFRLVIRIPNHTYDIFVTRAGGTEQTVGSNFAFRTEQSGVTNLSNWALYAQSGSHTVCNVTITSTTPPPPTPSSISGRVTTNASVALAGVIISAAGPSNKSTTTDSNGNYTLSGLAAGPYTLTPSKNGYTFSPASQPVSVPPNQTGVNFTGTATSGGNCTTSSGTWQNKAITSQIGTFAAEFDGTPNNAPMDGVMGLSAGSATAYAGMAAIARFSPTGYIDARNGGAYQAASQIPYTAGVRYHFRLVISIPSHTYGIFVTPAGGTEQVVGTNFAFRTEQNAVTSLSNFAMYAKTGSQQVCNVTITPVPTPPPTPIAANFTAVPTSGIAPLTVQFTDASQGNPTNWAWDFDNNGTTDSTQQNPSYTYNSPGIYTVKLTASGPGGSNTKTQYDYIAVSTPGDTGKPGGVWVAPSNNFVITNNQLHFEVHAYDNQGGSGVQKVNFTAFYSGQWHIVNTDTTPESGTDIYKYDWDASAVPAGPLTVSFDVYDNANNPNLAPNGTRQGEIQRSESSPASTKVFLPVITIGSVIDYFALGDSIASGHGLMDDEHACHQSTRAYPYRVRDELQKRYAQVNFYFPACSGATTEPPQSTDHPFKWFKTQMNFMLQKISSRPTLVSITVGIDDFGWADPIEMVDILLLKSDHDFALWVRNKTTQVASNIRTELDRIPARSNISVVITLYYNPINPTSRFFKLVPKGSCDFKTLGCYTRAEIAINELNKQLTALEQPGKVKVTQFLPKNFHNHRSPHRSESPENSCGDSSPETADTWIQYPGQPNINSTIPNDVRQKLGITAAFGDCFHLNDKGVEEYTRDVDAAAKELGR